MAETKGAFIVIEGTDGSGKKTQFALLKKKLEDQGYEVAAFDFPRYDRPSSYFVKRYLQGDYGTVNQVGPYTSSLFYALDRFEAAPAIRQALADGKVVLCNRFTGSNMAHQGTKLVHAEERRGFFIWLDNLEHEMLRIPRPDVCFVLRVPPAVAQELALQRGEPDIHEADLAQLERAAMVYDDMTQLFPKDFQRIDCVRGGKLLDIETVQSMLWEKVSPLLPPAPPANAKIKNRPAIAAEPEAPETTEPGVLPAARAEGDYLVLEGISSLLIGKIERVVGKVEIIPLDTPIVFVPQNLVPEAARNYKTQMEKLFSLQAKLAKSLTNEQAEAAKLALPVALCATIRIHADNGYLQDLLIRLLNDELPEAQAAGANLLAQAVQLKHPGLQKAKAPAKRTAPAAVKLLADELLAENHIGDQPPVQLVHVWPRNELDLVPDMLYAHTGLPLRTIQYRVSFWHMDQKLAVFEAYLGDTQPGPVLEKAHYSWDLLCPYHAFRSIQYHPAEALEPQVLTPRHGYDIPKPIEDAGQADTYEACYDLSLALYSALQQAGHHLEAQYATLHGHNTRFKLTHNAAQMLELRKQLHGDPLLQQMQEKQAEAHPLIGEDGSLGKNA